MRSRRSAIFSLIAANVAAYLFAAAAGDRIAGLALWPVGAGFAPWQLISYAFLHANVPHLAFNMFGLWMFGRDVEKLVGRRAFLRLYFVSVVSAGLTQLLVTGLLGNDLPMVGASGGVFGVLLAYGLCFPRRVIILLLPPIPMSARAFVLLYGIVELVLGVTGTQAGVAHFAHLGGMLGGYVMVRRWRR